MTDEPKRSAAADPMHPLHDPETKAILSRLPYLEKRRLYLPWIMRKVSGWMIFMGGAAFFVEAYQFLGEIRAGTVVTSYAKEVALLIGCFVAAAIGGLFRYFSIRMLGAGDHFDLFVSAYEEGYVPDILKFGKLILGAKPQLDDEIPGLLAKAAVLVMTDRTIETKEVPESDAEKSGRRSQARSMLAELVRRGVDTPFVAYHRAAFERAAAQDS